MAADLHTHTWHSDGTTSPAQNVALADEAGLGAVAITDHDTTAGWAEAADACRQHGIGFVPGIELSTQRRGASVHLLGYWVAEEDAALTKECARLRGEREGRLDRILARLADHDVPLRRDRVTQIAGSAPIGRPHVARAMVEAGHVHDVDTAFDRWLADGRPAHVHTPARDVRDGVELIHAAGGVAVVAHPALSRSEHMVELVEELAAVGLDGLEVDHPSQDAEVRRAWGSLVARLSLVRTGGSDYHGGHKAAILGQSTTGMRELRALEERRPLAIASGAAPDHPHGGCGPSPRKDSSW